MSATVSAPNARAIIVANSALVRLSSGLISLSDTPTSKPFCTAAVIAGADHPVGKSVNLSIPLASAAGIIPSAIESTSNTAINFLNRILTPT